MFHCQLYSMPISSGLPWISLQFLTVVLLLTSIITPNLAYSSPPPLKLILLRHGTSIFNQQSSLPTSGRFTGWLDVPLTLGGEVEAVQAGRHLAKLFPYGAIDACHCSCLVRSTKTAELLRRSLAEGYGTSNVIPVHTDWRLNERHYGALTGLNKEETANTLGRAKVMAWRRSYNATPPPMLSTHSHYLAINSPYNLLNITVPSTESLAATQLRVVAAYLSILNVPRPPSSPILIIAHANAIRALIMHLDDLDPTDIEAVTVDTCVPIVYNVTTDGGVVDARPPGVFRGTVVGGDGRVGWGSDEDGVRRTRTSKVCREH